MTNKIFKLKEAFRKIENLEVIEKESDIKRLSRDFYNYSPILKEKLDGCVADLVVRPKNITAVIDVAKICWGLSIPITLRGSGTGNYGQSVPLKKGVVMQMNYFDKIEQFFPETGFVRVQAGCLMGDLNKELERVGRELRLIPSTWRTATIGGFIAGGSGGIGSVQWGFLRDPGNVMGLEAVSVESNPQLLQFDAKQSEPLNHAYGTNGIITSLLLSTDIKRDWYSIVIDCESLELAIKILQTFTRSAIELKLGAILEKNIVAEMPSWFRKKNICHKILLQSTLGGQEIIKTICREYQLNIENLGKESDLENGISDLVWNHTTLQMRAKDKSWTYLQMLLPLDKELDLINSVNKIIGKKLLWHIEAVSQQGAPRLAALPVLQWTNENELNDIINHCRDYGALIFNPHVVTVEGGGLGVIDADQVKAKFKYDSKGLLNPGKLEGWKKNNLHSN